MTARLGNTLKPEELQISSPGTEFFQTEVHLEGHPSAIEVWGRTELESRKRATKVVEALNNQHVIDSQDSSEYAASVIARYVNDFNTGKYKDFARHICGEHRTLQQSAFLMMMECMAVWAKDYKDERFDARNEQTVKAADFIVRLFDFDRIDNRQLAPLTGAPAIFIDGKPHMPCI